MPYISHEPPNPEICTHPECNRGDGDLPPGRHIWQCPKCCAIHTIYIHQESKAIFVLESLPRSPDESQAPMLDKPPLPGKFEG